MRRALAGLLIVAACGGADDAPATAADSAAISPMTSLPDSGAQAGAGPTTPASAPNAPAPGTVQGKVIVSGIESVQQTSIQIAGGQSVEVKGTLEPELRALAGANVLVTGAEDAAGGRRMIDATSYEIVDIEGDKPLVGRYLAGQKLLVGADTFAMTGRLDAPVGAKIWVTGPVNGKQVTIRSMGVITR